MKYNINKVEFYNKGFPLHKHPVYEIIYYTEGQGKTCFSGKEYHIKKGDIVIIPPNFTHGTISNGGLKCIYVNGEFNQMFNPISPIFMKDNDKGEGYKLVQMLYDNRYGNKEYVSALCNAYSQFLLQNITFEDGPSLAVKKIIAQITEQFCSVDLSLNELLCSCGYAEDYIRAQFKKITGKTPNGFLTDLRIKRAMHLIEIYKNVMSLTEIASSCGYYDYVYFSRKFKSVTGKSPTEYKKGL